MATPSELLTRAADLIRDAAAETTPGPWEADRRYSRPNVVFAKADLIDSVGVAGHRMDLDPIFTGQVASRPRAAWEADARWIALLNPSVAGPLEAWLRSESQMVVTSTALAFARAVLGLVDTPEEAK